MAEVIFTSSSVSNTNADLKKDSSVTVSFTHSSGTLPPAGSTIQSVNVGFSSINVYISSGGFSTPYGSLSLDEASSGGSQNHNLSSPSSSLLNFTGGSITFTVTRSSSGTGNVVNVRSACAVTMTITYVASTASSGYLGATSVNQGSAIALNITPASSSYTHSVIWFRDASHTKTNSLAAGVASDSYTIPTSWPTGAATATLVSYFGGVEVGRNTYNFTINIDPSTVQPSVTAISASLLQDSAIPAAWGVYVKGFSKAIIGCTCTPGNGATVKSLLVSCGSQSKSFTSVQTFTTEVLTETGALSYNAKLTNSYNNSASYPTSKTITVYDYYAPIFASAQAFRCLANGTPSDTGAYISVTVNVNIASVSSKNGLIALQAQYTPINSSTWSTAQAVTNNGTTVIGGGLSGDGGYQVKITAIDTVQNNQNTASTVTIAVLTSSHVIFCKDGGLNVSFGMEGTHNNALEINGNWDIYHGSTKISGTVPIARGGTGATNATDARTNLAITPASIGARPATWTPTAADVGARPATWTPTAADVGAAAASHNHDASSINTGTLNAARLPFKVAYGSTTVTGVGWSSVSFSGFSSTPKIVVSYAGNASSSGINVLKTQAESSTGFQVCMAGSSGSGSRTVNWIAIGT